MVFIKYLENIKMTKNKPCIRWKQAENLFFTVDLFPTTTVNNWSPVYIWHENKVGFCIIKYWNSVFFFTKHHHILMIVTKSLWEKSVFSNYQLWWPKWQGSYFHYVDDLSRELALVKESKKHCFQYYTTPIEFVVAQARTTLIFWKQRKKLF